MELRIATWNVNSVRLRLAGIRRFVREQSPDVLCLQETKVVDSLFPLEELRRLGFDHCARSGEKGYNGVAILSRLPLQRVGRRLWCGKPDCRHLYARLPGGVEIHNIYVPAGGPLPDPTRNPRFAHKLQFLEELTRWFRRRRRNGNRFILLGDLNVAPHENDVWSHQRLRRSVTHTPVEVAALARLRESHGWIDAVRRFVPESEKLFSWWSYRAPNWRRLNKGRRLDHIWVTPALAGALVAVESIAAARGWRRPSDHAPVLARIRV